MRSGAEGYLSNGSSPDLALRALSFVLKGGTYFPRSAVAHLPFPDEPSLKGKAEVHAEVLCHTRSSAPNRCQPRPQNYCHLPSCLN